MSSFSNKRNCNHFGQIGQQPPKRVRIKSRLDGHDVSVPPMSMVSKHESIWDFFRRTEKEDKKFNSKEYKLEKADQKTREYDKSGVIKLPALTNDNGKLST